MDRQITAIRQISYHRNGVSGRSFYAALFVCKDNGLMVAAIFPNGEDDEVIPTFNMDEPEIAVFQLDKLMEETVAFGENSWRGDYYAPAIITEIQRIARRRD